MKSKFSRRSFLKSSLAASALGFFRSEQAAAEPKTQNVHLTMNYTRLADSPAELETFYEVLIIGSGYGGSVMAARLSRHHQVALFERGREWVPGEFPETFQQMKSNLYCESHPLGLYSYHTHRDIDVMCGSGLGGTSLINAGVVIAPDRDMFKKQGWPEEIQKPLLKVSLKATIAAWKAC
ncbi:NAD(P)-binding protein [Bdellovibrio bacteriovorus]|uniref:NAD(P)-binding protein n=1 Tax=Bdellovibrio bacteriovorus TaxID=959 RepID=UPI0035A62C9B